jgi:hypothetical protein
MIDNPIPVIAFASLIGVLIIWYLWSDDKI